MINASCEDIVTELQRQLAINNIQYLQRTRDSGTDIMVQCPYHGYGQERKPSAGIRKSDGTFHCFACGETHSLCEVISYVWGHTNDILGKEGFKWIMKNFATVQVEERKDVEIDLERNHTSVQSSVVDSSDSDKSKWVSEEELDKYRYHHRYWETRGIVDEDIIELFDLGYDSNTRSITFPVRDVDGHCLFVARRNIRTKFFNYPKGVDKPLYGIYELRQRLANQQLIVGGRNCGKSFKMEQMSKLFICESMIDCILLCQAGYLAVALNGTGSELQYKQLKEFPMRHYVLATDNDKAGKQARNKIRTNVPNKLYTEIDFPIDIKDVGDLGKAGRFKDIEHIVQWEVF